MSPCNTGYEISGLFRRPWEDLFSKMHVFVRDTPIGQWQCPALNPRASELKVKTPKKGLIKPGHNRLKGVARFSFRDTL